MVPDLTVTRDDIAAICRLLGVHWDEVRTINLDAEFKAGTIEVECRDGGFSHLDPDMPGKVCVKVLTVEITNEDPTDG